MSLHITESENEITDDIQGDLARIGSNDLLCSDPEVIRYMSSARANWHRSDWYDAMSLDVYCDNVISTKHPVTHDQLRSKLIQGVRYISFCIVKKRGGKGKQGGTACGPTKQVSWRMGDESLSRTAFSTKFSKFIEL